MNKVSIVIPTYNASKTISKAVDASLKQTYPSDKIEIIIVDDGSTDNTAEIIKKFPVKYIYQENGGPAKARNTGWRKATGEIILFTDSDCVPEKEWVSKMIALFEHDDIAAVGGTYGNENPEFIISFCIHHEILFRHATLPEYVKYLGSYNLGIRKKILEEMDGFDETYLIACGEDADLTYRITYKNYRLRFSQKNEVGHHFPIKFLKYLKQQYWRGYWLMKLLKRHVGRLGNDNYSRLRDTIQPPLYFLILITLPLCFYKIFIFGWITLNAIAILIHLPVVIFSYKLSKKSKALFLFIMLYLRGFSWALGCVAGFYKFILLKKIN